MSGQSRAARRTFIRENHPDRGGDPAAFVQGLQFLDEHSEGSVPMTDPPTVFAYRSRRTAPARWFRRLRHSRQQGRNLQ